MSKNQYIMSLSFHADTTIVVEAENAKEAEAKFRDMNSWTSRETGFEREIKATLERGGEVELFAADLISPDWDSIEEI